MKANEEAFCVNGRVLIVTDGMYVRDTKRPCGSQAEATKERDERTARSET